jgi:hypothetical protein
MGWFGDEQFKSRISFPGTKLKPSGWVEEVRSIAADLSPKEYSPWPHVLVSGSSHLLLS